MLCQAYQQIQCAGNSCSVGAHVCAMVDRDSSHVRGTKHPACKHRWGKKAAESDALQTYDYVQAPLGGTTNYHARTKRFTASLPRDRAIAILKETDEARRKMWTERVQGPKAAAPPRPPRATDGSGTGATQRTVLLDTSGGSEEQGGSETDDECLPPRCADTLAERNRAMSRTMVWRGWTTSSFGKFLAEYSCIWAECKCRHSKHVESETVQTEVFSQMRRAQATWIALDCRALTKTDIVTPGQQRHYIPPPPPLRRAKELWNKIRLGPSSGSTEWWAHQPLSTAEQSVLLEQSDSSAFVGEALKIIQEASEGQATRQLSVIENPRESWLWDFDFTKPNQWSLDTSDDEVWSDDDYSSCFWACVRAKKQELRTNMLSDKQALYIGGMSDAQCHNLHMQE